MQRTTRRQYIGGIAAAFGTAALGTVSANQGSTGESWSQFSYGAAHSGYAPDNTAPSGNPDKLWSSNNNDAWKWPFSYPVVADGKVYFGERDKTVAVDEATGESQWTFDKAARTAPVVGDGVLYVTTSTGLYALDTDSGDEQWSISYESTERDRLHPSTLHDGTLYAPLRSKGLRALDAETGETKWERFADDRITSKTAPTVADGTLYLGFGRSLRALDVETGDDAWSLETGGDPNSTPAVVDGTVYTSFEDDAVYAIDATSGESLWQTTLGDVGVNECSLAVADGTVIAPSHNTTIYGLDAESGEQRWKFGAGSSMSSSPAVVDGTVYVGSFSGLHALDLADGNEQFKKDLEGGVYSAPAVANGQVYVTATREIAAFGAESTSGQSGDSGQQRDDSADNDDGPTEPTSANGPGFGVVAGVAGLGSAAAYLAHRSHDDDSE